ncbi:MAG: UDP-N-acetylmuramate--L-alanine ligase [Actinomycetota bacterium]|nr:UDP-N-acetylmuramate--L-alanine ligase [Actinomycetota bacterium]
MTRPSDEPTTTPSVDLSAPRRVHLIGIGGSGMSAIATVLADMGHTVSGSDRAGSAAVERLVARGVDARVGHDAANVAGAEIVARSTAIADDNVEVVAARAAGLDVLERARLIPAMARTRRRIAVAGTHGKTTTSAMLAHILAATGHHPSFIVGGDVVGLGGGRWDPDGEWFVVEADESDGTFLTLDPEIAVVANVEPDHLEHWGGEAELRAAFRRYADTATTAVVVHVDDPGAAEVADATTAPAVWSIGAADREPMWTIDGLGAGSDGGWADLRGPDGTTHRVTVPQPGEHNALDGVLAVVAATAAGVDTADAVGALAVNPGVARRLEPRGEAGGVRFFDDYAHLPSEARAVLAAARSLAPERIVAVFQPHRYSRTEAVGADFADAFGEADLLAITDIYTAGETPRPGVTGRIVLNAVLDAHPWKHVAWLPSLDDVVQWAAAVLRPGDLCLTMGAGDLTTVPDRIRARVQERAAGGPPAPGAAS